MMFSLKSIVAAVAFGLCLAATAVSAQDTGGMAPAPATSSMGHMGSGMHGKMHHKMNGSMHKMPATVTSVDTSTGVVEVTAEGMALKVHFPAASVANLKTGDNITLHMGFSKP
jgi:hypothetical protein